MGTQEQDNEVHGTNHDGVRTGMNTVSECWPLLFLVHIYAVLISKQAKGKKKVLPPPMLVTVVSMLEINNLSVKNKT